MFIDGSSVTVTRVGAGPTGSIVTNTDPYVIGNRGAGDRNWDGQFAEFAIWDGVALNGQEAAALARGYSPLLIRAASLAEYLPLLRNNVSIKLAAPTITGTAVQPHPRILMPHNHKLTKLHTVPVFNSAWAKGANLPVLGTGNY